MNVSSAEHEHPLPRARHPRLARCRHRPCHRPAPRAGVGRLGADDHGVRDVRLRTRLGPHGPAVDPVQRPAATVDGGAGAVPRHHRARPDGVPARSRGHGPAELDLAPGSRRPGCLDDPGSATQPPRSRSLARPPGHRGASARGRGWCLRDRQRSHSRNRADRSRPDGRRGRPPALHRMHGLRQPDRRPPGGARRVVLLMGNHRAEGRRVDKGLRLRPRRPWP